MRKYRIPDNAAVRVVPAEDGGIAMMVRLPGDTVVLLASAYVARALAEEINRATDFACNGGSHG
ncbi:hypothetical protein [Methylomonas sp. ZR1]|uniref:hypothetical protein n=1 Tax=Methylomonas sp. ZR1 TaxID=1797072 RepID=UPI001492038A|nr:hypothetical protein [Methylomonas sp. ZR1]NOV29204.1 hypothetical protein [Methylomonas sp. ZR1]